VEVVTGDLRCRPSTRTPPAILGRAARGFEEFVTDRIEAFS
jgi:hypothetical protein